MDIKEYTPYGIIDYAIQNHGMESLLYSLILKLAAECYDNPNDEYLLQLLTDLAIAGNNYKDRNSE